MKHNISIELLKSISDKNYANGRPVYTIDFDEMQAELPEVKELTLLGVTRRNGYYEAAFIHPKKGGGRWLNLGMTKGQLKKLHAEMGI